MNTVNAYEIGQDWVDINTVTGIAVGSPMLLQNIGRPNDVFIGVIGDSEPVSDFRGVFMKQITPIYRVTEGEGRLWVRLFRYDNENLGDHIALLQVQEE